jgi:hypothetical protein
MWKHSRTGGMQEWARKFSVLAQRAVAFFVHWMSRTLGKRHAAISENAMESLEAREMFREKDQSVC